MSPGVELKPPSNPPELDWAERDSAVEAMAEWFHANFEDPAMETPYEGAEGGYIYIWGGPYNAQEELWDAFPDATEELISRAADEIQAGGLFDWAPAGSRIQPEEEPDEPLEARLEALGGQLDRIEQYIAYWRNRSPNMGHNGPPEEFRLDPDDADLVAAEASVAEIRVELAKADRENTADVEVIQRAESAFQKLASKVWGWLKKGAGLLACGAVTGVGTGMGADLWDNPKVFLGALQDAGTTLAQWGQNLIPPF